MIRNASHHHPHRVLARMPAGAHVMLRDGSVWTKAVRRFMPAGWVIPTPLRPLALVALNGGALPTPLLPAHTMEVAA